MRITAPISRAWAHSVASHPGGAAAAGNVIGEGPHELRRFTLKGCMSVFAQT